jgi:hypothetical protein
LQLLQAPQLADPETSLLRLPSKIRLLGYAELATHCTDFGSRFDLTKRADDRFLTAFFSRHWGWGF